MVLGVGLSPGSRRSVRREWRRGGEEREEIGELLLLLWALCWGLLQGPAEIGKLTS
jgi:hypothetical protein